MALTRKNGIKLHRELWDWLFNNPKREKCEWPRWKSNGGNIELVFNLCFVCELCDTHCNLCIINHNPTNIRPYENPDNYCLEGYWKKWKNAKTSKTKKKYAAIIRDLPEKTDI